jgi:transcriptional regulator with XRE-family HTH domain
MNRKIKALLVSKGIKQKEIAESLGVSHVAVTGVLNGHWKSERVQRHIADMLGKDYTKLWGQTDRANKSKV